MADLPLHADDWARVEPVLDAALDARPEDREATIRSLTGGDQALAERVRALVAATELPDGLLAAPAPEAAVPFLDLRRGRLEPGERVGAYRVIREAGRGGMGTVYLCEREGLGVRAALKMASGASAEATARFRAEERHLARLEHPHIPRLYDAGVARNGEPYLVMEYADGAPITEHADRYGLDFRQRLRLFRQLCDAVDHAHERRVVHRDVKPSNVLVVGRGEEARVKLIDFGVARRLDPFPTFDTRLLAGGGASGDGASVGEASDDGAPGALAPEAARALAPMTPAYAAPEQREGGAIGPAADLYALGCLLFELVAGRPLRADGTPAVPEPAAFPRRIGHRARRDLAAVVARATAPEAGDRYSSVAEMARDVDRLRDGAPVEARAGGPLARMARRVPRRTLMLALGGAVLFFTGAAVAWVWGPTPDTVSAGVVNATINALALEIAENAREGDTAEALLDRMLDRTGPDVGRYEGFEGDLALTLALAFDVAGEPGENCAMAAPLFARTIEVRRRLAPDHPALAQALLGRSRCLHGQESMLHVDGLAAVEQAQEAVGILDRVYGADSPISAVARLDLAHAWDAAGEHEKGLALALDAKEVLDRADVRRSARRALRASRSAGAWILPDAVLIDEDWMLDRRMRALQSVADSYRIAERFGEATAVLERDLAPLHGAMRDRGWLDGSVVSGYFIWAVSLRSEGRWEEAEVRYRQWAEVAETVHGADHRIAAEARSAIASLAIDRGQWAYAAELYGPIIEEAEAMDDPGHLALMLRRRAYALRHAGDHDAALVDVRRALAFSPDSMSVATHAVLHADLAQILLDAGQATEALGAARRGSDIMETLSGYTSAGALVDVARARALVANGLPQQGLAVAQEALADAEARPESPGRSRALGRAWAVIAEAHARLGDAEASGEAAALAERLSAEGRPG